MKKQSMSFGKPMIFVPAARLGDMLTDHLISGGLWYFKANLQFVFILPVTAW